MQSINTNNYLVSHNMFNYLGQKVLTDINTKEYKTLPELYTLLKELEKDPKYATVSKFNLPYLLTTKCELGILKGQKGEANFLMLDVDGNGVERADVEEQLSSFEYIMYNSFSNGVKEGERFRAIIALDRGYSTDEMKLMKTTLISIFSYVDINSFKRNTLMYAPVFYEGVRDPFIKYNAGSPMSFERLLERVQNENALIEKEKTEKGILMEKALRLGAIPMNNNGISFNRGRQQATINNVLSTYQGEGRHITHDWLFRSMIILKGTGMSDEDVISTLEPYETAEHKGKIARDIVNYEPSVSPFYIDQTLDNKAEILKSILPLEDNSTPIKVVKYLSEISEYIHDEIATHDKLLIQADTNIGKTYFFTHTTEKTLVVLPTRLLVEQIVGKLKKELIPVSEVLAGKTPDLSQNLIISTYDGLAKFNTTEGKKWLSECIFVVDEAHNLSISASYTFRQEAMRLVQNVVAKKCIYLTASPILTDSFTNTFYKILVEKEVRREKKLVPIFYKNKLNSLLAKIEEIDGKQIVYLNNKKKLEELKIVLEGIGKNVQLISSDTIEDFQDLILEGTIEENIDIVLTTSVLGEGFRFSQDFEALHLLSQISPEMIYQMSERPENNAISTTYIYMSTKKALYSADFLLFDISRERELLTVEAKRIVELTKGMLADDVSTYLTNDLYSYDTDDTFQKFHKETEKFIIDQFCEKYGNLVYNTNNTLEVNELGINYEIHKKNTEYYWRNPAALVQKLLGYNFKLSDVIISEISKTDERVKNTKKIQEIKIAEKKVEFDNNIDHVVNDVLEFLDDYNIQDVQLIKEKLELIGNVIEVENTKEAGEILKAVGVNDRKLAQFLKRVKISNTNMALRSKFQYNKAYTSAEISIIVNEFMINNTIFKYKLTNTKTTQIVKDLFEVQTKHNKLLGQRTYTLLSNNSYKNDVNIEIKGLHTGYVNNLLLPYF